MIGLPRPWRDGGNGFIVAPRRGDPPPAPEGFVPFCGDKYCLKRPLDPCDHRDPYQCETCTGKVIKNRCLKFDIEVASYAQCDNCIKKNKNQ